MNYSNFDEVMYSIFGKELEICPIEEEPHDFHLRFLGRLKDKLIVVEPYFDDYDFIDFATKVDWNVRNFKTLIGWEESDYEFYVIHFSKNNFTIDPSKIYNNKYLKYKIEGAEQWVLEELFSDTPIKKYKNQSSNNMQNLINDIVTIIKDYRIDEGFGTSPARVLRWIQQFDKQDQEFILTELKNILEKRYYSKEKAKNFLVSVIEHLKKEFEYQTIKDFLDDTIFLDLQPPRKSQKIFLELLEEVLKDKYSYDFNACGNKQSKNFVYLDDILCTGNTLYRDIETWIKTTDNSNTSNLENLKNDKIRLVFAYIFIHTKNYDKKLGQFYHNVDANFRNMIKTIGHIHIDKEYVFPVEENQPQIVLDHQTKITQQAEEQAKGKYTYPSEFYRDKTVPSKEDFFTSPENRIRFENIMLKKGVEILNASNTKKNNIRPLGYSLPSYKDFGFGTLCFTWRNVPNNTPLVFWYSSGGFFPLFEKNQTN